MTGIFAQFKQWIGIRNTPNYPYPAIDITLPDNISLHLVGSIHMGVPTMAPLSDVLLDKIQRADAILVEADISIDAQPFDEQSLVRAPLETRVHHDLLEKITQQATQLQIPFYQLDNKPLWQIALILQSTQAVSLGLQPQYGIDYQALQFAHQQQRTVIELEGIDDQVSLLLNFPNDGQSLLEDSLKNWHENAHTLQMMINGWLNYNSEQQPATLPNTFSQAVFDILMEKRNQQWAKTLSHLPAGDYVVIVGALHLFGEESLIHLLTEKTQK